MKNFFSRPYEFSFKDLLAAMFCGVFLYFGWQALESEQALAVVQALVPLIGIILGGYFVQESATIWFNRSQEAQLPNVYTQSTTTTSTQSIAQETLAPAGSPDKPTI